MDEVRQVLANATPEELSMMSSVLGCAAEVEAIVSLLQRTSVHFVKRLFGELPTYSDILRKTADHMGVESTGLDNRTVEKRICQRILGDVWQKLSPQQKEEFNRKLRENAGKFKRGGLAGGIALTGTALLGANLGGFATYMLASTAVGALTGALGITLPFAAYMGMSGAIAAIVGPPGWIAFGLFALWRLGRADLDKTTTAVAMISMIRSRQEAEPRGQGRDWRWAAIVGIILMMVLVLVGTLLHR